jgi:hypothetical protein
MEDKFNIKALQTRISEVKEQTEQTTEFALRYLECLANRHDLFRVMDEDQEFGDVPEEVSSALKNGMMPSKEDLDKMDVQSKDFLIKDCVYLCGLAAIYWYSENHPLYEDAPVNPFEQIIKMPDISPGHHTAAYIISALALLSSCIPSFDLIESMTNNFDSSLEQLEKNIINFDNICLMIIQRYNEDLEYYAQKK